MQDFLFPGDLCYNPGLMDDFHDLLILMVVVWGMGKIFRTLSLPMIFGELIGGILVGPSVLGIIHPDTPSLQILAQLGVFFLMLHAGLESDPHELFRGSKKSILIALLGVIAPFLGGYLVSRVYELEIYQSLFVATAISATAIAVSVRILKDYKLQNTQFGHTVLSAAILTDIILLIVFSAILNLAGTDSIDFTSLSLTLLKIILFFVVIIFVGFKTSKYIGKFFRNKGFTLTLILALALGYLAEWIGLHIIIGAFLAGLFIRQEVLEEAVFEKIEDRIYGLSYSFLGPIFFATLALNLVFDGMIDSPRLFLILFVTAFLGKLIGTAGAALLQKVEAKKSLLIGFTMNSRGAVDLIMISIALRSGIIDTNLFSILIAISFGTTMIAILAIKPLKKYVKFQTT